MDITLVINLICPGERLYLLLVDFSEIILFFYFLRFFLSYADFCFVFWLLLKKK